MRGFFGAKVRYLRAQQALTQSELAHRAGLASHTHINHIEAGRRAPSLELVIQIANIFGVTTDYLLRDTVPVEAPGFHSMNDQSNYLLQPIVERLRDLRIQRGITQKELTQQLGLTSQGYISKLEAGYKEPSPDLIVRIADRFEVTTDDLLVRRKDGRVDFFQVKSRSLHRVTGSNSEDGVSPEE